ncbi:7-cyano-7-deazaguanine synthase QueC [Kiritimatiella glycovorans]|uniref:7-cyano-7-deazaguanine synthase n=1 Tax=Kiritimatiella glycovorans TaxID=1307763 RepID=A0A0G3ED20_9BACT|nr:7-cyano-7-deazaguanine synthase QueC [Kiritimatiella glycovorans]AKJ64356.1 7-cyano-7-deazaguanine synthase [Kiritimatiella glycovorans]
MRATNRRAVVLLSGGLDSATVLAEARSHDLECYALTLRYGQRHELELDAARAVADDLGVKEHLVMDLDLRRIGGSALTADLDVPRGEKRPGGGTAAAIPVTYVPARNTIFLSIALGWAEVLGTGDIYIGVNAVDYSGYPDCRPEFIDAFEAMASLATRESVEGRIRVQIHTPLIGMSKAEIIARGRRLGVDYGLTRTCYDPEGDGRACGQCEACRLRRKGFEEAGLQDPIEYAKG